MLYLIQYEGFIGHWASSTNKGLESLNAQIKLGGTYREQLSIKEFFARAVKIVNDWSKERNPLIEAYYCTFICQKVGLVKVLKIPQKYKRKNIKKKATRGRKTLADMKS